MKDCICLKCSKNMLIDINPDRYGCICGDDILTCNRDCCKCGGPDVDGWCEFNPITEQEERENMIVKCVLMAITIILIMVFVITTR